MAQRRLYRATDYPAELQHMTTAEIAGRLRAWADVRGMKLAALLRDVVSAGLAVLEPQWIKAYGGELDPDFLAGHVAGAVKKKRERENASAA